MAVLVPPELFDLVDVCQVDEAGSGALVAATLVIGSGRHRPGEAATNALGLVEIKDAFLYPGRNVIEAGGREAVVDVSRSLGAGRLHGTDRERKDGDDPFHGVNLSVRIN
jgi:hypothetical protein